MKQILPGCMLLIMLASCTGSDDNPTPTPPQQESALIRRENYYYLKQPDGQWVKQPDMREYNFKYNADGSLSSIESYQPGVDEDWYKLVYEQGKFTGIAHFYINWWFTFHERRLRTLRYKSPGGPGDQETLTTLCYRTDGKIDSTVRRALPDVGTNNLRSKRVWVWSGDDLARIEHYQIDNEVATLKLTETFTYEDRLLSPNFSKMPEGMEFFILSHVYPEEWFFYSKRLIKERVASQTNSQMHNVTSWTHELDSKGKLSASEVKREFYGHDNVLSTEHCGYITYKYNNQPG